MHLRTPSVSRPLVMDMRDLSRPYKKKTVGNQPYMYFVKINFATKQRAL